MGIPHVKSSCQEKNFQKKLLPCHKSISPVLNLECLLCSVSIAGKWGMSASLMSHLTCDSLSMKVSGYAFLLLVRGNFMEQVSYYRHFWRSPQLPSQLGEGHLSHRSQMLSDEYVNEWRIKSLCLRTLNFPILHWLSTQSYLYNMTMLCFILGMPTVICCNSRESTNTLTGILVS